MAISRAQIRARSHTEWLTKGGKLVQDDAHGPHVALVRVRLIVAQLRAHVIRRAHVRTGQCLRSLQGCRGVGVQGCEQVGAQGKDGLAC